MRTTKEAQRIFLWLSPREFMELESCVPAIRRFTLDTIDQQGYMNLILDYPMGKLVAVLENHHESVFNSMKLEPPYEQMCVVRLKNHRDEFAILHEGGEWEVYGDGAGLEGDITGWLLLPK